MSATPTTELARFIARLQYEDLPAAIRERVKDIILDTLASAIAGRQGHESPQVRALARALGGSGEASVIGGERLSLAGATLLNGYLITAVTVCDVHRPTLCHVTPQVVPPALALAERAGASGKALLLAVAAGLETTVRIGLGTKYPAFRARGWHSPGVIGPFGGAAAAGKLLGLDAERQLMAFGLAGSQSAGTFAHWGTPTIKFHQSRGALSGLMAGLLAEQGFLASREILAHEDGGIFNSYSDGGNPDAVVADLGSRWTLEQISLRLWPGASSTQSATTALFALIKAHDIRPEHVAEVRIGLSKEVYDMHGTLGWDDKFKALLSTTYVTAIVLHDRRCWLDQFEPARYQDRTVGAFARERVRIRIDPSIEGTAALVEIKTTDGATYVDRRVLAKGEPGDPLTRAEIQDKLRTAAAGFLAVDAVERIIALVDGLERIEDVRELLTAVRAPTGAADLPRSRRA
ncbi:MAG: MmgE/PrpD family protein [Betaproteobacteria bacterium]|nr:MmgE/PrpD family protein [Betaproteobacteria bacterium]